MAMNKYGLLITLEIIVGFSASLWTHNAKYIPVTLVAVVLTYSLACNAFKPKKQKER